jgi:acyl-CoA thioesterase I
VLKYVALGDSTGAGVGANGEGYPELLFRRLKAEGYPVGILNVSQSGATTSHLLGGPVQKAVSKSPDLVTLGVGTNDLWKMIPLDTFRMNLKLIADALEKSGAEVIVSNVTDLSLAPVAAVIEAFFMIPKQMFLTRLMQFNDVLGALARRPRFTVVDLYGQSRAELASPQGAELFSPDGFHPSPKGYERWAGLLWPHVEAAAKKWRDAHPPDATGA